MSEALAVVENLSHDFDGVPALRGISATIQPGMITGLVGPDGAGKTTFLRLLAGLLRPSTGRITVMGYDMARDSAKAHGSIGYMPQRFGLYEDLTVGENLDLSADLHSMGDQARSSRTQRLLQFTGLSPFRGRMAGQLSGGMKQKLGLACALLARPRLLLLDEPSVGVDPASRRELWAIVSAMLQEGMADGMGVIWATAYQDEAAKCGEVLVLHQGTLLAATTPAKFTAPMRGRVFRLSTDDPHRRHAASLAGLHQAVLDAVVEGSDVRIVLRENVATPAAKNLGGNALTPTPPRFEDAFLNALSSRVTARKPEVAKGVAPKSDVPVIEVADLVRKFGDFTAVSDVTFAVKPGEIFGLLGPNGAGKSTTFRMLCGLLRPSSGTARVAGLDLMSAPADARAKLGYMAQKFSLYRELSVNENLRFFGQIYGLTGTRRANAIKAALVSFDLTENANMVANDLSLGAKQRLALAASLLHGPQILFLDEPTSGVDPIARREFWGRIGALADQGVAVLVTSHFMDEAEYCDRLAIISDGKMIATGTPADLRARVRSASLPDPTLEDAFIELVEQSKTKALAA